MGKNIGKTALPRKRPRRVVDNYEYATFTRRVLKAYARRVADGDVEFLRSMVLLRSDVDAQLRVAVRGLRAFGYTWSEIAARLGVSKQAALMRYGDRAERGALDRRLLEAGLGVSLATLVKVFVDHHPGWPLPDTCPGCGYPYPTGAANADCPSLAVARQLLYRRRNEDEALLRRLPADLYADLHDRKTVRAQPKPAPVTWPPRPRPRESWQPAGALVPITNPNGSPGGRHDA